MLAYTGYCHLTSRCTNYTTISMYIIRKSLLHQQKMTIKFAYSMMVILHYILNDVCDRKRNQLRKMSLFSPLTFEHCNQFINVSFVIEERMVDWSERRRLQREKHEVKTPQASNGTKAKNATSCGNAFVTNILLAWGGWGHARGKRPSET